MNKDMNKELELINSNGSISGKLYLLLCYNNVNNEIFATSSKLYKEEFSRYMEKAFKAVVDGINSQTGVTVSSSEFINRYIEELKKTDIYTFSAVNHLIRNGVDTSFGVSPQDFDIVDRIEEFDTLPLDVKFSIMMQLKEYINHIDSKLVFCYDKNNIPLAYKNLYDVLLSKLDKYLKDSTEKGVSNEDIIKNFKPTIMESTKDYLLDKLQNGGIIIDDFNDLVKRECSELDEDELKIALMSIMVVMISGYDRKDISYKERSKAVGFSRAKYLKSSTSLAKKLSKKLHNSNEFASLIDTESSIGMKK